MAVLFLTIGCVSTDEPPEATAKDPPVTASTDGPSRDPADESIPAKDVANLPAEQPPLAEDPQERSTVRGEPYQIGGDVQRPKRIDGHHSEELLELLRSGKYAWGSCILGAVITRDGKVTEIELLKPDAVAPEVERILGEMFQGWRFEPATQHGKPVAVRFSLVIHHCPLWPRGQRPQSAGSARPPTASTR